MWPKNIYLLLVHLTLHYSCIRCVWLMVIYDFAWSQAT